MYFNIFSCFDGFAIHMHHSGVLAADGEAVGEQGYHFTVFVDILGEELEGGLWYFVWIERFEYGDIHFAIFHIGAGCDVCFVAIL